MTEVGDRFVLEVTEIDDKGTCWLGVPDLVKYLTVVSAAAADHYLKPLAPIILEREELAEPDPRINSTPRWGWAEAPFELLRFAQRTDVGTKIIDLNLEEALRLFYYIREVLEPAEDILTEWRVPLPKEETEDD